MPAGPPGPERVLEEEADHVVLGKELGDGAEIGTTDLARGGIDFVLLVLLPVLVDPSERIVGEEDLNGEAGEDALEGIAALGGEAETNAGIVETEDTGEDLGGKAGGDGPAVGLAQFGG